MKIYLRILAVLYLFGACLHGLDFFDLRLHFSEMDSVWKSWTLYLFIFDLVAATGLWLEKRWGIAAFVFIAASQLLAYLCFQSFFGQQTFLVAFHILTLTLFALLFFQSRIMLSSRLGKQIERIQ